MQTKICPSGNITMGETFNTDGCKRSGDAIDNTVTNCAITPLNVGCTATPIGKGCDAGKHWVVTGSRIAHCVVNDMACGWGKSLIHDFLGNPSCINNTCPSNQVLQADGISCACAVGLVWDGSVCVVPCVDVAGANDVAACGAGFTGSKSRTTSTNSCTFAVTNGAWDTSSCVPSACVPTQIPGADQIQACGAGYTGNKSRKTSTNSCTFAVTYGAWDTSSCVPSACVPTQIPRVDQIQTCGAGFTGNKSRKTSTNSCTFAVTYGAWDKSNCSFIFTPPSCVWGLGSSGQQDSSCGPSQVTSPNTAIAQYDGQPCASGGSWMTIYRGCDQVGLVTEITASCVCVKHHQLLFMKTWTQAAVQIVAMHMLVI